MITIIAFFFVLSLLVIVHELGHYTIAKLGGISVHRFSIGFPPRLFGIKIGETDYCISAIPFGGYVKLAGQEDFDKEEDYDYNPKDYRGKSTPLKIAVLVAGSLMNIFAAVVIFALLFFFNGVPESTNVIGDVEPGTLAYEMGLRVGDEVVKVQGKEVKRFDDILLPLYMDDNVTITVKTLEQEHTLTAPRKLEQNDDFGASPFYEAIVDNVLSEGPAEKAGFLPGDVISKIEDEDIYGWHHMSRIVRANPDREKVFTLLRDGAEIDIPVLIGHVAQDMPDGTRKTVGRIGVSLHVPTREVGLIESSLLAVKNTVFLATHMLDFLGKLITGRISSKLLGGPVMIAQMAGESAKSGVANLMAFTAFISINLGILNLMPFPVLDGGHIFILLSEAIIRRKLPVKVRFAIQQTGMLLLLSLMLYITFNDIMRFETIAKLFGGN